MTFNAEKHPHRRLNPLTGEWLLVSPHRTQRPWQGQQEKSQDLTRPAYDPACYLCPGNRRASGAENEHYIGTYVFTNDFAALHPQVPADDTPRELLFQREPVRGTCRVICFSPRHDLTLPRMPENEIEDVIGVWMSQTDELLRTYCWVQVFENKGEVMGCSNPHPHGQVWAMSALPHLAALEDKHQDDYLRSQDAHLLIDYVERELRLGERIVLADDHWVALVPFWAVWPFETLLLPRRHVPRITLLTGDQKRSLASILKRLLTLYDRLFDTSFPYSMGWHGAPQGEGPLSYWQLHAHFYPPLLRSASVKKFMVGFEMLAEAQRDLTPEQAAVRLRQVAD